MICRIREGVLIATLLASTACGGGGGSDGNGNVGPVVQPAPPPPPANTPVAGVFRDANVAGLEFVSGAESGVTGAGGDFTCESGNSVTFSVGAVELGMTECATLITPASLTTSGALDDMEVINRVRFLLMLDVDGDPSNGIEISTAVQEIARNWVQPDFAAADFDAELAVIISDAFSVDQTMHDLPDAATAAAHLRSTVECAYGGAFAGSMAGDLNGTMQINIGLRAFANSAFSPDVLDWRGVGQDEFFVGGGGSNSIVYAALPMIAHEGTNLAGPMTGQFDDPDRISGSWASPSFGLSGTFSVERLGSHDGDFRFVGAFSGNDTEGPIGLNLTGNAVSGEAFDIVDGARFIVTGTVTGETMSLTATGTAETVTASASIIRDSNGDPVSLSGSWSGGTMRASACRLN